jgi:protein-disulfide isomerase
MLRSLMLSALLSAGFVLGTSGVVHAAEAPAQAPTEAPAAKFAHATLERVLGKADAPVTLIEYAALTCSHCAEFHTMVLPELKKNYIDTGKVRLVFRDFPFNETGMKAAMAARCLPEARYFDFVGTLFTTQNNWLNASGETLLKQMAGFAGLPEADYNACVNDKALQDYLLNVRVEATNNDGVNSTPTILIEGTFERIVGAQDYKTYAEAIDRQLAKLGKQ